MLATPIALPVGFLAIVLGIASVIAEVLRTVDPAVSSERNVEF